jgi:hypothetical protein
MKHQLRKKNKFKSNVLITTVLPRRQDHHLDAGLKKIGKYIAHVLSANKKEDK